MSAIPFIGIEIEKRLDWQRLIDALAEGHRGPRPALGDLFLARGENTLLSRAAWIEGLGAAVKSVTVMPGNAARGLPSVHGAMILFDDATGRVEAVIDSGLVTKWKTAGDSVLGARLLAREDASRLLIIGAGAVAASLVEAYGAIFPGIAITVWNRNRARAEALARQAPHPVAVADDLVAAIAAADIVATATLAKEPVVRGEWLREGQHLDLIGAFTKEMREADDEALRRSRIFVDSRETTIGHIGEIAIPLAAGVIAEEDIEGDLADLVAGRAGRRSREEITLYKNGGGAHLDLMTARVILEAARAG
jgi:ornithine cyclodeaminase/alanine dehydrogenase-like protein (mu-crystallin family)